MRGGEVFLGVYEYRTASFLVKVHGEGLPVKEVDAELARLVQDRWEFVHMNTFANPGFATNAFVVLLVRRLID